MNKLEAAFWIVVVAYLAFFALNSLTGTRWFSPDSMNYADVARNLANGRGLMASSLGYNPHFSPDDTMPTPYTSQGPLYPILIALVSLFGPSYSSSALLVTTAFYALAVVLVFLLGREKRDNEPAAYFATTVMLFYFPIREVSKWAWTEVIGIAFLVLSLWLLHQYSHRGNNVWFLLAGGLALSLAFATRYVLFLGFVLGIPLLIDRHDLKQTLRALIAYAIGIATPAGIIVSRNLTLTGFIFGWDPNPSVRPLASNIGDVTGALFGHYAAGFDPLAQSTILLWFLVFLSVGLLHQRNFSSVLKLSFLEEKRFVLFGWSVLYFVFMIVVSTKYGSYALPDYRLVAPGAVTLLVVFCGVISHTLGRIADQYVMLGVLFLAPIALGNEVRFFIEQPRYDQQRAIAASQRLTWIQNETTDRDLLIGELTDDAPFYFWRTAAVSFYPYPSNDHPDYAKLTEFVRRQCNNFDRFFMVWKPRFASEEGWRYGYGPFIADIVSGRLAEYPGIVFYRRLNDAIIFQMIPIGCEAK